MKHQHIIACICLSMSYLTSCQSENLTISTQTVRLPITIVARIGNTPTITGRYAGEDLNHVDFAPGDSIGIFMNEDPIVQWNYSSLTWTPKSYMYWTDKTTPHSFKAFYPYTYATSYEAIPMPNLQEQTGSMASVSLCDFLVSSITQSYGDDGTVRFQGTNKSFQHISSLICLKIKGNEDLSEATLKSIRIHGENLVSPSIYSFEEGVKLSPDEFSDELNITLNQPVRGTDQTYFLIVNEKLDNSDIVTLSIEYEKDGDIYTAQKSNFANNVFKGGVQQSFTIVIRNNVLTLSGAEIESWTTGEEMEDIIINAEEKLS